jgi:hypothetical protein
MIDLDFPNGCGFLISAPESQDRASHHANADTDRSPANAGAAPVSLVAPAANRKPARWV